MIKLKSLIRLNEQFPQPDPMAGGMGAPVPMQAPPPPTTPQPEEQPQAPTPETDTTPSPEDPSEYDWTKDFRSFEDAKNKAEAQAKKKLLDKMNKQIVGKRITTNASRGYGQPKTDHTIDKVKKVSVEFWYKEWVVIVQDENDKKYFLTPGVNIKMEQGAEGEPGTDDQAPTEPDPAATGASGEEQPNASPDMGTQAAPDMETSPAGGLPPEQPAAVSPAPVPGAEAQPPAPVAQQPDQQPPVPAPVKKKKKIAESTTSNEEVSKDLKNFLAPYMVNENADFTKYIKKVKSLVNEVRSAKVYRVNLEIPADHMKQPVDIREIKLSAKDSMWSSGNIDGRFSRGSIDISKIGKVYVMEFVRQTEWKS